jgi:uncharacterized membrane protein YdbT with pleckstrin-like domain
MSHTPSIQVPGRTKESSDFDLSPYMTAQNDYGESQDLAPTYGTTLEIHKKRQIRRRRFLVFALIGVIAIILVVTLPVVLTQQNRQSSYLPTPLVFG